MKYLIISVVAAMAMGVVAEPTNTVKVMKFHQSYPYSGKETVEYMVGGVQLWENGPYWAECNVGTTKPEEYGYYFWCGDTVGYTNTGNGWISVKDGTGISFTYSGTAGLTYGKDNSALLSAGYIDSTGNLVAAHDAATARPTILRLSRHRVTVRRISISTYSSVGCDETSFSRSASIL